MASPLTGEGAVPGPLKVGCDQGIYRFSTGSRQLVDIGSRRRWHTEVDRGWTGPAERFCRHHADCGAGVLAEVLGTTPRDVVDHMGALGVDVPPVPLLGDVCPLCGGRMPVSGHAAESGVCDACHTRILRELRAADRAERRERAATTAELDTVRHPRGYAPDGAFAYEEWRHRTDLR